MVKKVDTLIVGGGITGISLASFLSNDDYLIIEKEDEVGGYCKTIKRNGFIWDYSGHFFHFKDESIKKYILDNLDCKLFEIKKISHIFYKNELIDFPFQNNIHQLPIDEFIECIHDLLNIKKQKSNTFKEYVKNSLGESISNKFIIPYNEKLYKCDLNSLDVSAMGRFFPKNSTVVRLLENIRYGKNIESYNDTFIYPENGCFEFIKSILKRIDQNKIQTNTELLHVDVNNKKVITNKGEIIYNNLVSTIPFNIFYNKTTSKNFNFTSNKVAVFNLGFDKETKIKSNWIYFPGKEIFYRVGFYNNILNSKNMSLYVEVSFKTDEKINEEELLTKVMFDLNKCGIVDTHNLVDHQFLILNPAYVHITKESNNLYKSWNVKFNKKNVYSIGRYGSWTYCSIEDNIKDAKKMKEILEIID
jgi:protoporphyrinogen oxidase